MLIFKSNSLIKCIHKSSHFKVNNHLSMRYSSSSSWHLISAVCLERLPILAPELNWLEKRMQSVLRKVEVNQSLYNDHEMRHFEDIRRAKRIASSQNVDDKDLDAASKLTAQDFEDKSMQDLKQFTPSTRITQADEIIDKKSLDRCLDKHLMLVTHMKMPNGKYEWLLPQARHEDKETMRETAERALNTLVGDELKVKYLGNVPRAVYCYKYPKPIAKEYEPQAVGAKIFFFKAQYVEGNVEVNQQLVDNHFWLNRKELNELLKARYWKAVNESLVFEEPVDISLLIQKNRRFKRYIDKQKNVATSGSQ